MEITVVLTDQIRSEQRVLMARRSKTLAETLRLAALDAELAAREATIQARMAERAASEQRAKAAKMTSRYTFRRHINEQGPLTQADWDRFAR